MADETPKVGQSAKNPGNRGKGRVKGVPNKSTALLKDAILKAATDAGGDGGLVGYLTLQAMEQPAAFMSLLGKVLPMQLVGTGEGGSHVHRVEMTFVRSDADAQDR